MRVLASDYDGTLRIEEKVTKADLEALARWREAGNLFVAVTGRSMESFTREIAENGFGCDYIIANNGGVIYDGKMNRMQVNYMDFDRAMALIGYIRTLPCASYVINDGYYRHRIVVNEQEEDLKYGKMPQEKNEAELLASGKIAQIVISLNDDALSAEIIAHIHEAFSDCVVAYANRHCVDIVPRGISKAKGLAFVLADAGVSVQDAVTIGDSYNDLPMIEAYHGFCMDSAPLDIQEKSRGVYHSVGACIADLMK